MTQKSPARKQRDDELANQIKKAGLNVSLKEARKMKEDNTFPQVDTDNKCWDELQALHASIVQQMGIANLHLGQAFARTELIPFLQNKNEVTTVLRGHVSDLRKFEEELNNIYINHKDLTGGMKDQDDLFKAFNIGEAYSQFQTRYSCNIMPNATFLIDSIGQAAEAYEKDKLQNEASNIDVVTDVVIKEKKAE